MLFFSFCACILLDLRYPSAQSQKKRKHFPNEKLLDKAHKSRHCQISEKERKTAVSIPIPMKWHFLDNPDTLQITWILFRSYGYWAYHPDTFEIIWTLFGSTNTIRSPGHFSDHLHCQQTFHIIQTVFRSSGHFSYHPNTFQIIPILLDGLDTFQIIWILCRPSADFLYLILILY